MHNSQGSWRSADGGQAQTGAPYTAARRAAVNEHQAAGGQLSPKGTGYVLRMSGEFHDWLADLRGRDPSAAMRVAQALAALMKRRRRPRISAGGLPSQF